MAITPNGESRDILTQSEAIHVMADINDIRDIAYKLQEIIYNIKLGLIKIRKINSRNQFNIDVIGNKFKNCIEQLV